MEAEMFLRNQSSEPSVCVDHDRLCAALVTHTDLEIPRGMPAPIPLVHKKGEEIVIFARGRSGRTCPEVRERALEPYRRALLNRA